MQGQDERLQISAAEISQDHTLASKPGLRRSEKGNAPQSQKGQKPSNKSCTQKCRYEYMALTSMFSPAQEKEREKERERLEQEKEREREKEKDSFEKGPFYLALEPC